jgi:hypothetical protein
LSYISDCILDITHVYIIVNILIPSFSKV